MKKRLLIIGLGLLAILPTLASARVRVVGVWGGPVFYPGWYGYAPYYAPYYAVPANVGQIKIDTKDKNAQVFVNGDFAGTVKDLKTMTMRTGSYDIQVREPGQPTFEQRVYVVAGKTTKLHPNFEQPVPAAGA